MQPMREKPRPLASRDGGSRGLLRRPGAIWGTGLTSLVLLVVIIGAVYTPNGPTDFVGVPFEGPSSYALLGTDAVGRDVLSRVMCGGTVILSLSAIAAVLGVAAGGLLGISAGYIGGLTDDVIMRIMDVFSGFSADHPGLALRERPRLELLADRHPRRRHPCAAGGPRDPGRLPACRGGGLRALRARGRSPALPDHGAGDPAQRSRSAAGGGRPPLHLSPSH